MTFPRLMPDTFLRRRRRRRGEEEEGEKMQMSSGGWRRRGRVVDASKRPAGPGSRL